MEYEVCMTLYRIKQKSTGLYVETVKWIFQCSPAGRVFTNINELRTTWNNMPSFKGDFAIECYDLSYMIDPAEFFQDRVELEDV